MIIQMNGQCTEIRNPERPKLKPRVFTFDYSYWSHDGFTERRDGYLEPETTTFADQQIIFNDLGLEVLDNAWKGYNTSLFAYGQTGSGKSYSMLGHGVNKGIVPLVCEELFSAITKKRAEANEDEEYKVTFSMLEIYNEQVRDLLNTSTFGIKGGLRVRENAKGGFYVEDMKAVGVHSYGDIDAMINEGTNNRTIASTVMNATSSRAHTIVAINFSQKFLGEAGDSMTRSSTINLVDLAGSERAGAVGAIGDRLKEGTEINKSLTALGNCIKTLAEINLKGKRRSHILVQFRESLLTKLLKNALGGNSKTIMIAALSPADINYAETMSTLRFAERAKAVKTLAVVNERPTDKLIRELREENARLMEMLKAGDDLIEMVREANAMSETLGKKRKFELAMCAPQVRRMEEEETNEVCVRMHNVHNDTVFIWDRNKFINRKHSMQEMYTNFMNGEDDWDLPKDRDPFWEDPDTEVHLGSVYVNLQPLANRTALEDSLEVTYNRRMKQGRLQVAITPCGKDGKELTSKDKQEPEELVGYLIINLFNVTILCTDVT
ncbi:hypothetical protein NP493_790g00004 [Ridgeia piscesae]|uniref:Kinesin-like protein n=1 Tax=Ridgeia piscesae TaxID=27915 RepID=A0AAD9KNS6_RIDPI|nr:hypothetical protein NP493_790g00004 [Ridgeia piscesae]